MKLYNIEYQTRLEQIFSRKIVGRDEDDVVNDISSIVGEIIVLSLY